MRLTSFGFIAKAESFLRDALLLPPVGGGGWSFQRSVNFGERASALQVVLISPAGISKTKVAVHARQTGSPKDYSIQGWSEVPDQDKRSNFVLKQSDPVRIDEEVFDIVVRLLENIPERDDSVVLQRPVAPAPKSSFSPLIPELQNFSSDPRPESVPVPEAFDSTQAFVDALLSAENGDQGSPAGDSVVAPGPVEPQAEAPILPDAVIPDQPAIETPLPKAKTGKSKKTAK
ncbi:MAG: hypothetical protein WCG66_01490 [bacterium]